MDHKTTLPFFSLRSQSSLGCCQIKLCIVTSWVVSTKLSLPSSFEIVSSRMASKTRARAPSISCLLCDGLVAYTRADRQRWPFICTTHVSGKCHRCYFKCFTICRFDSHMKVEHGASANLSYLLAGCLMSKVGSAYWNGFQKNKYSMIPNTNHISDSNLQTSMFWRRRREMLFPPSLKRGKRAKLMLSLWRSKNWYIFQINF